PEPVVEQRRPRLRPSGRQWRRAHRGRGLRQPERRVLVRGQLAQRAAVRRDRGRERGNDERVRPVGGLDLGGGVQLERQPVLELGDAAAGQVHLDHLWVGGGGQRGERAGLVAG